MLKAPQFPNEEQRLAELQKYGILDTPPEINLDELTYIASYICETPISLISIVDKERQWFKAKIGLETQQTPRDVSFCGHAIAQDEVFVIENAELDVRFKDNPLVIGEPNVIFYAGAPLITPAGFKLGMLCVIDHKPKTLTSEQKKILKTLANQVIQHFEMQMLFNKIRTEQKNLIVHAKMLSLGEMASGLAHEINNPLMIITGKLHLLQEYIKEQSGNLDLSYLLSELNKIETTKERIKDIIYNLKQFAKNSENEMFQPYILLHLLNETLLLCKEKLKNRNIEIKISYEPHLENFKLTCKPTIIRQAFFNLLLNSYDALEHAKVKEIDIKFLADHEKVKIYFCDSGSGIAEEMQDKIMQPFFTTKEIGKGIGLGLSATKGIIEEHDGNFYLDNSQEKTCFIIEIPLKKTT